MKEPDTFLKICIIGVVFFLFIEAFYNVMIDVNAYVFMNLGEILSILPTLLIAIILIVVMVASFNSRRLITHKYRLFAILVLISILRLIAQLIPIIWILLPVNLLQLFAGMVFFNEIILLIQNQENSLNFNSFIGGIIFGVGIQFAFLIISVSSNITTNIMKLIPIILILICLTIINIKLFFPTFHKTTVEDAKAENKKKEISYIHFVILGILFLINMILIMNPMALSAYGVINLNFSTPILYFPWISYGFTYYIFIILITAIITFYIFTKYIFELDKLKLKMFSLGFGALFILINCLSLLFMGTERMVVATVFFTVTTVINIGFLVYYSLYIFNSYSFNSRRKLLIGLVIFFVTILIFILIQVQVLWYEYISLLINVIILIGTFGVLVATIEIYNFSKVGNTRDFNLQINKNITAILFATVILANGVLLGVVFVQRSSVAQGSDNPIFMTWNIHNGIGIDDEFNLDRLIERIKKEDPDVLGLNEVDMGALKTSFVDIGSYFGHYLNMYYYYGYTFYKHYGNVLLSKYPISNAQIIELPLAVKSAEPRSMIKATLEINSSLWTVFLTHLSTEKKDREAQVPFIVNKINEEPFNRVVWMGDFNFEPSSGEYALVNSTSSLNFTDTHQSDPADTFIDPPKRIDYIMCSPDLIPTQTEVICTQGSDHCAVVTKF